jgi:hypothetical protein
MTVRGAFMTAKAAIRAAPRCDPSARPRRMAVDRDCYHPNYEGAPQDGSAWIQGADCSRHIVRGGAWDVLPRDIRSAYRAGFITGYRNALAQWPWRTAISDPLQTHSYRGRHITHHARRERRQCSGRRRCHGRRQHVRHHEVLRRHAPSSASARKHVLKSDCQSPHLRHCKHWTHSRRSPRAANPYGES